MQGSEIARLRQQIELECQAMQLAMTGYAAVAKHETITHKYSQLGASFEQLETVVGKEQAAIIWIETYQKVLG